jgi:sarcosine oxidase
LGLPRPLIDEHGGWYSGHTVDPTLGPSPPDPARADRDRAFVRRRLPSFDPEPLETETCLYTMTPDADFVLERAGPVAVCSPRSRHGFKFAPSLGELVAALVCDEEPPFPRERFPRERLALEPS